MHRPWLVVALAAVACPLLAQDLPEGRLMRFPDIRGNAIVFSYAGDLWSVPASGGAASRLTTNPGLELFPRFSPDGKWIAFTGQYDGNFNVYVMSAAGGEPRQLTFERDVESMPERMGPNNEVINWTPDGRILFLSRRDTFNTWFGRLFTIGVDGGLPERLPIDKGGLTSFSPDGTKIAYNRIFRNFRTWKRYTGGMAQDIWTYDFKAGKSERLTDYPGTDTYPMWREQTIYFGSDRGPEHRMNLYAYDLATRATTQLTDFKDYDVEWPSLGGSTIVFTCGGYLYTFDLATRETKKVVVQLPGDRDLARKHWGNVASLVTDFDVSPEGNRAVFSARGDVFTVPAKDGATRNLTRSPGAREKYATWSPDSKLVAYVSDKSGEDELYVVPQDGSGEEQRITTDGSVLRLAPVWSPDSRKLAYADKSLRLYYVDLAAKKPVLVDQGKYADLTDYAWSPDSKWIAYAKAAENLNQAIYLYALADAKTTSVTTSFTNSWQPVFDPAGKYLYFLSMRDYNEVLGVYDFEFANPKATRVYVVTLRSDLASPFAPRSDEAGKKDESEKDGDKEKGSEKEKDKGKQQKSTKEAAEDVAKTFRIDLAGVQDRVVVLPISPANIETLQASKERVYYGTQPVVGLSGPLPGESPAIHAFDLKDRKDVVLIEGAAAFVLSFDGEKVLYEAKKPWGGEEEGGAEGAASFGIVDAKPESAPHKVGDGALSLAGLNAEIDPRAEWRQMFDEAWRQERDFFFEPAMNGVDWSKERARYEPLLPYVADRFDLTYLIGEMLGELSNSHTYVGGGDYPDLKPVKVGMLGVDFELDAARGLYRFKKIYVGQNWDAALRSPLTEPGVGVKAGDYLIAVDGRPLKAPTSPYEPFANKAGENVTLTVNAAPTAQGARTVTVQPIESELRLRELDMIETNRKKVDAASQGKIGYIYLPDMSTEGLNAFVKQFFPQVRKQGLIFDVRYNGGGFVDQLIFERLRRILAGMTAARNFENSTIPDVVFHGSMACVTNHYAASDGDFFTYFFKKYGLGPVIGTRTWGGVRGIRGEIPLMDGGYVTRPEFSLYGLDGQWLIENRGVAPDIEVDNLPEQVMAGHDPQLEKAIEAVMKEIQAHPKALPARPPDLPTYPGNPG